MEFFTTIPAMRITPMKAAVESVLPVTSSDQSAPISARGMALMMINGCRNDWQAGMTEK